MPLIDKLKGLFGGEGEPQGPEQPSPPLLEYEWTTRFPTRQGNWRLRVLADGRVLRQRNEAEPMPGQAWCSEYPEKPHRRVSRADALLEPLLRQHGFFEMSEVYPSLASDGFQETLRWLAEGGAHRVTVVNGAHPAFQELVKVLLRKVG